ncbi:MAG TPA: diaminopimelate epimerase [Dehalococcoidia bacterium]|nr:diaminopimelate epimerase [Dehalococcoidia bacterium]
MQFVKSHGLGNDYIVVEPAELPFALTPATVRLLCDRNFGIGSDGILARREPTGEAPFAVAIFNPDGSEAEKSGNGIRIFAKFLSDYGRVQDTRFVIETSGGDVSVVVRTNKGRVTSVAANMGVASIDESLRQIEVAGKVLDIVSLSVGNPHCVVVVEDLEGIDVQDLGPAIERHPAFPNRTNVQFARIIERNRVAIKIWERGAGETLASGSSSCAVAAACRYLGLVGDEVTINMDGGELLISVDEAGEITMDGPVEESFRGELSAELLERLAALQ